MKDKPKATVSTDPAKLCTLCRAKYERDGWQGIPHVAVASEKFAEVQKGDRCWACGRRRLNV